MRGFGFLWYSKYKKTYRIHLEVIELQGIGEILKKTREAQGISLDEVAEATKIRSKYLKALEEEAFDQLPGDVYAKGFATAYLKYLGIKDRPDVIEIMTPKSKTVEVSAEKENESERTERTERTAPRAKRRKRADRFEETPLNKNAKTIILLSLAAILLLFCVQGLYTKQMGDDLPQTDPIQQEQQGDPEVQEPEEPQVPEEPTEPQQPVYDGLEIRLEILNVNPNAKDQCWMQITADGKTTDTTLAEGQIQDIKATQSVKLHLGNAGVVDITVNGQKLGTLGKQGQVVKKTFQAEDYVTAAQ